MITAEQVIEWMGIDIPLSDSHLSLVCPAVNEYVESLPSIDRTPEGDWAGTTQLGAVMLAARLYRRKNSAGGIEAAGETVTYVSRTDSDISRLLNIDAFRKPMVG